MTLQYLGGRSLLLQRLTQIVSALAQFVEQPRILDGDDRLSSEVGNDFNLLLAKWADFFAVDARTPINRTLF